MLDFFLAVTFIAVALVAVYAVTWLTPRLVARFRARRMTADRMNRLITRECANLDQDTYDLLRRKPADPMTELGLSPPLVLRGEDRPARIWRRPTRPMRSAMSQSNGSPISPSIETSRRALGSGLQAAPSSGCCWRSIAEQGYEREPPLDIDTTVRPESQSSKRTARSEAWSRLSMIKVPGRWQSTGSRKYRVPSRSRKVSGQRPARVIS